MLAQANAIADALVAAIATQLGIAIARRYVAYFDKAAVATGKYLAIPSTGEQSLKRGLAQHEFTIDVAYQIALPPGPDPLNNMQWLDQQSTKLKAISDLFYPGPDRPEGALYRANFSGATFAGYSQSPLYHVDMLLNNQIFTSVLKLQMEVHP